MDKQKAIKAISSGQVYLGLELGSSRIKTVLIDSDYNVLAAGSHDWENSLLDGIWTYSLAEAEQGLQASYRSMADQVQELYGLQVTSARALGVSGMMHGYLPFDQEGQLLVPFRTWRNNMTAPAASQLADLFGHPIPQRWSIAHLYQAMLAGEDHLDRIAHLTTLAGYLHWRLTGQKVLGIGEASGVFPIDPTLKDYNQAMLAAFDQLLVKHDLPFTLKEILPQVLVAGQPAGSLSQAGALLLDPSGDLKAGIPLCPPEGDAGTGMVATNSVAVRTGNVSAGTSVFAMLVLEKQLQAVHAEVDLVTTPAGDLVAMVHSNNCTSDYDAWLGLFGQVLEQMGWGYQKSELYENLLSLALQGDPACGGLLSYGYLAGEHITGFEQGRPLFVRQPDSNFNLANFMRSQLFSALAALRIGLDILFQKEKVQLDELRGHGGFFKTELVGQKIMAAATGVPVSVMETAAEGGAWGIALLAAFLDHGQGQSLASFLSQRVFNQKTGQVIDPDPADLAGFNEYLARYQAGLAIERAAVEQLP